jgi:hypothetical protein
MAPRMATQLIELHLTTSTQDCVAVYRIAKAASGSMTILQPVSVAATSDRHRLARIKRSQVANPVFVLSCSALEPVAPKEDALVAGVIAGAIAQSPSASWHAAV